MLSKMFQRVELSKQDRGKFVPFVNQRNFMGALLPLNQKVDEDRVNQMMNTKNLALIQNLRKSTKEYFFEKKYQKMAKRLKHIEESMHRKEHNFDQEVNHCFQTLNFTKTFHPSHSENLSYYVDLKQSLNQKISIIKRSLIGKIQSQRNSQAQKQQRRHNLEAEFQENELRVTRNIRNISQAKQQLTQGLDKSINRQIFKQVGKNSQFMSDFSNQGLKHRHLVHSKKINPWKKWYVKENIELFPGQTICIKKLQKTIY